MNGMEIRHATLDDIEGLLEMGREFWKVTPYIKQDIPFDKETVKEFFTNLINEHYLVVVDCSVGLLGFIGFLITPFVFNKDYTVAQEAFFWIAPSMRGIGSQLLEAVEQDLEELVDVISMGELKTASELGEFYNDRGYSHTESIYTKAI